MEDKQGIVRKHTSNYEVIPLSGESQVEEKLIEFKCPTDVRMYLKVMSTQYLIVENKLVF